ncbi:MAG: hypothetical protein KF768_12540, partial [Phycisphaeraceae bacterium]|nr:hypothetical protein [Phycisphaeraceae bacterium]
MKTKMWKAGAIAALAGMCMVGAAQAQSLTCAGAGMHPISVGVPVTGTFSLSQPVETTPDPIGCIQSSAGRSQWWSFTPAVSGRYTISMCDSLHSDTHLGISELSEPCTGTAQYIGCNDDACGLGSQVVVNLVGGTAYRIRSAAWGSSITNGGIYSVLITLEDVAAPVNNDCAMATVATLGSNSGNLNGATGDFDANACGGTADIPDVYYTFTAGAAGTYRFSVCTGDFDAVMSLHSACPSNPTTFQLACGTSGGPLATALCPNRGVTLTRAMAAAEQIWIRVAGASDQAAVTGANSSQPQPYVGFGAFTLEVFGPGGAAPANDTCATAQTITAMPAFGSIANEFGTDSGPIAGCDLFGDVWFTWTATASGALTLNEAGTQNAGWAVYSGATCGSLTSVLCSLTDSGVTALVTMGTQYFIRLGADTLATARTVPLNYNIFFTAAPANDACANAQTISSFPFSTSVANVAAANDGPLGGCELFGDIWYTFTAPGSGLAVLNETGTQNAGWAAYDADPCGGMAASVLCTLTDSGVTFPVTMGTTYWVRLGSDTNATARTTPLAFNIDIAVSPANDECANAETIASMPFSATVANLAATSTGDTVGGCNGFFAVWYTWTATANGALTLNETGAQDSAWAVYDGDPCSDTVASIVCTLTDSGVSVFPVFSGTTYWIRLGANSGTVSRTTPLAFNIQFSPAPSNDDCDDADTLDLSMGGSVTVDARGALNDDDIDCNGATAEAVAGVWYTFTTTDGGVLNVNETSTATVATQLYTGGCGSLTTVPASCSTTQNRNFTLNANTTYHMIMAMSAGTRPTVAYAFTYSFTPATGACCVGASCSLVTASACTMMGGTYQGDNAPCTGAPNYVSSDPSGTIPDLSFIAHTITTADTDVITTLEVVVDAQHTWAGDVILRLVAPNLTEAKLLTRPGRAGNCEVTGSPFGTANDLDGVYIFSDDGVEGANAASVANAVLPSGTYRATECENVFVDLNTVFGGMPVTGTWTLRAEDWGSGLTGLLRGFSLVVNGGLAPPCSAPPCPGDYNGDNVVDLADL